MAHVICTKDGKHQILFDLQDALYLVEEYAGHDLREFLEETMQEILDEQSDYKEEAADCEQQLERSLDHQHRMLTDILLEMESVEKELDAQRLNRKKLQTSIGNLCRMIRAEL